MQNGVVDQVEARWILGGDEQKLPMFILSPFNAGDVDHLRAYLSTSSQTGEDADIQFRFLGVSIAGPEDNSARFEYETRLDALFDNVFADTANYYDATYLLAYAMYGAGSDEPLTGSSIARGMKRLVSGAPVPIGPLDILSTYQALSDPDVTVQIQSTLGPPTFDAETGVRQIDGSVFCFARNGTEVTVTVDSYRYDRALGDLRKSERGDDFCINGFFQD
jgi:hypothetical protein